MTCPEWARSCKGAWSSLAFHPVTVILVCPSCYDSDTPRERQYRNHPAPFPAEYESPNKVIPPTTRVGGTSARALGDTTPRLRGAR